MASASEPTINSESASEAVAEITRTDAEVPTTVTEWSLTKRICFRLACVYFVLYAFPFPIGALPGTETLGSYYEAIWQKLVPWVATHILHLSYAISFAPTGSGDTTYSWVLNLIYLFLAIVGGAIWSVLDRRRSNYDRLHNWLRLYVRIYVGVVMIGYGAFKVIQSQFPAPNLIRLLQPYGDSSPMGLLWTFMGSSYTYNLFTGAAEVVGGALLIIPPLATLGALLTIAAMGNVFVLNMAYDVPVKLFSFNLILMAAFVALPDAQRLLNIFVLNRSTQAAEPRPLFNRLRLNDAMRWLQLILLVVFLGFSLFQSWQQAQGILKGKVSDKLLGIWSVQEQKVDDQVRLPAMADSTRWQRVVFEQSTRLGVQFMDAPFERYSMELDEQSQTVKLTSRDNPDWKSNLKYELVPPNGMVLQGEVDGHRVEMKLQRKDPATFRLFNRGFHWISEAPFNR